MGISGFIHKIFSCPPFLLNCSMSCQCSGNLTGGHLPQEHKHVVFKEGVKPSELAGTALGAGTQQSCCSAGGTQPWILGGTDLGAGSGGVDGCDRALVHVRAACVCSAESKILPRPCHVTSLTPLPSPQHWQPPLRCMWTIFTFALGQGKWMARLW